MHSYLMIYLLLWQSVWKFPDIQNIVIQQNSPPLPLNYPQTQNPFPSRQYDYGLEPDHSICAKYQNSSQNTGRRLILQLPWGCYKLVKVCEEGENSTSRPFIERVINCLESAVKFVENVLPIVNDCKRELTEVAGNLRALFHSWCQKLTELGLRNTPNCTHLAVYLVTSLELTVNGEPGRPKYEIDEETLLHFRALGYKWKEIAEIQILMIVCKHSWTYKEALWGIQWFEATWEVWVLMFKENVFEPVFHELIRSTAVWDGQQRFLKELIQCQALTVYGILTAITVWLRGVSL